MVTTTKPGVRTQARFVQMAGLARVLLRLLVRNRALWATIIISLLATLWAYAPISWLQRWSQIPANSTYYMGQFLAPEFGLTCVLCAFMVAALALEDQRRRVDALVFARPISSLWYVVAKISTLVAVVLGILALDVTLAVVVQPWLAVARAPSIPQAVVFWPYVELYIAMAVPAAFFLVPCAWLLAISSHRMLVSFSPLLLWWVIIFGTPFGLAADLFAGSRTSLGIWFDPTGLAYARQVWIQATTQHPNASYLLHFGLVPLSGSFIISRLCFVALGLLALPLGAWVTTRQRRPGHETIKDPAG
jgi:hypothetical protein